MCFSRKNLGIFQGITRNQVLLKDIHEGERDVSWAVELSRPIGFEDFEKELNFLQTEVRSHWKQAVLI